LLVAHDKQLQQLLVIWDAAKVRRKDRLSHSPVSGDSESVWRWLWDNVQYSVDELAELSGVSRPTTEKKMAVLIGNRIIYPDGSVTRLVAKFLRVKVLRLFGAGN
jgi:hypothetical protein